MSLVDDLKAAHEAATPGPWFDSPVQALPGCHTIRQSGLNRPVARMTVDEVCAAEDYGVGSTDADAELIVLTRNALPEIIAVLEAARRIQDWGWGADAPDQCERDFIDLRDALDALEEKG